MQQSSRPSHAPGAVVGARFRLGRKLGEGGMGEVFEAIDLQTDARIALKLMRRELASDARAVERFRREGAALATVHHPAIVQIREVGELEDGTLYLAMELLEGETLSARLQRVGPMTPAQLLPIVRGICDGLAAAHTSGIVHRDIKPSNVHLPDAAALREAERSGERAAVKLVDFGVARIAGFSKMTSTGLAVGTVRYMAPEQLSGGAVDERADLYSLGVVLYEALGGEHPFERTSGEDPIGAVLVGRATPLSALRPDLPPAITRVVHRAMARLATERFASARALADAFAEAAAAPAETAPTPTRRASAGDPVAGEMGLADTALARPASTSVPSESEVRAKGSRPARRKRPPVYLLLPLLVGVCLVPTFGVAGFIGCGTWMTDLQVRLAVRSVRFAIEDDPATLAPYGERLDRLEALHEQDRVNLFAAAAFNKRVQDALERDGRVTAAELPRIMAVVDDIVARGGEYDIETYTKMAEPQ